MLKNVNRTINMSATAAVETKNGMVNVMFLSANVQGDGNFNINQSTQNMEEYLANKETIDADFSEFQRKVTEIAKGFQNDNEK